MMKTRKYSAVAVKTAFVFFVFGFLWILLSDTALHYIVNNNEVEIKLQTYKGWFFITITSILIYHLVKQQVKTIIDLNHKLTISKKNLSAVLENIGEGIIYTNPSGCIIEMNLTAQQITGFSEIEARGRQFEEIFRQLDEKCGNSQFIDQSWSEVSTNKRKFVCIETKNQTVLTVHLRIDKLFDAEGNQTGTITVFKDTTDSIAREKALRDSESRMRALLETSHDLIWSSDSIGNITYINDASKSIYGLSPDEMLGHSFADFVSKEKFKKNEQVFLENLQQGKNSVEFEGEIINKRGETVFLKDNTVALFDEKGNLTGLFGASKDITEKKKAEKALMESKERLELALSGGNLAIWDYVLADNLLIVNETYKEMLGLRFEGSIITMDYFIQLIHPDDINLINEALHNVVTYQNEKFSFDFRMKHQDGTYRWIHSMGKVADREFNNIVVRLIGTNQDITDRKQLENELQRWVHIYQSFIKYSAEGIYLFEPDNPIPVDLSVEEQIFHFYHHGKIILCNDAFAKMYGYTKSSEIEGIGLFALHGGDDKPENLTFLRKFIEFNYRIAHEISQEIDKNGNTIFLSNNVIGIIENKKLVRIWGSQLDISDQLQAHHKLETSELKYRLLFETNPVPLLIFDIDNLMLYDINKAAETLLEYSKEELVSQTIRIIRPEITGYDDSDVKDRLIEELSKTVEFRLKTKSNRLIQVEVKSDQIDYGDNRAVLSALNDLTSLRETEKKVMQSLIEGEDNERRRVAKELHDSLGQSLTAASLNFDSVIKTISLLDHTKSEKFKTGMTFLNQAIEETRNIAKNLMPQAIEDFGLIPSLKSLFAIVEKTTGITITFIQNLENYRLNIQTEMNIYRITQEALNNVTKHASATEIIVQIILHSTEIIYTFEDNGKGFDISGIKPGQRGMGIGSMNNRVLAMAGEFEIESKPGTGTSILIQIPYF